jgi:hypothetical protein
MDVLEEVKLAVLAGVRSLTDRVTDAERLHRERAKRGR